jgi:hypothetical protein
MVRRLLIVLVVISVVLAGCGGLSSSGNESPSDGTATPQSTATGTEAGTETGAKTGTDTETATETDSGKIEYPPGYAKSGITNPAKAIEQHVSALRSHNSFTYTLKRPTTRPNAGITLTAKIDTAEKRLYMTFNGSLGGKQILHAERYQVGNTRYWLSSTSFTDRRSFNVTKQPFTNPFASTSAQEVPLSVWVGNVSFGEAKQVTRDGETLLRYESTKLRNVNAFLSTAVKGEDVTVKEFNATLLVDTEGIIRSFEYSITYTVSIPTRMNRSSGAMQMNRSMNGSSNAKQMNGSSTTTQVTTTGMIQISNIDSTTVEKPKWLKEAKKRTNRSSTGTQTANTTAA